MQADLAELENRLWDAADELRANSGLKASEYSAPVLGLIFLRFADARFEAAREAIEAKASARRKIGPSDYHAERLIYLARRGALRVPCSSCPRAPTSARPSTRRCAWSRSTTPTSPASCRGPTRRSPTPRSRRCCATSAATRRTSRATPSA